jgi:hypothetical protein
MRQRIWLPIVIGLLVIPASPGASDSSDAVASEYTKLSSPPCKTTGVQFEGGNSEQACPGIHGYRLLLLDSDGRMSVTIVTPDGARHPLDFWNTVTPNFSTIKGQAEWRVRKQNNQKTPVGIIVPLEVREDPESNGVTSYLVVAKLDRKSICVVRKVRAGVNTLAEARRVADTAAGIACPSH